MTLVLPSIIIRAKFMYELVPVGEPDEETGEYTEFEERDVTPGWRKSYCGAKREECYRLYRA